MRKELQGRRAQFFVIYQALADEILRLGAERLWNVGQLSDFKLLNQVYDVTDTVPGVFCR